MTFLSRAVTVTALTVALAGPALAAHASGEDWKTMATSAGGKVQACKVATTATGPWKVKLRIDATHATTRVEGAGYAMKGSKTIDAWKSGWVTKGHVSAVGTVKLPRGKNYTLSAGIGTGQMGDGGSFAAGQIRGC
jgi:hypothetical protein